MGRYVDAVWPTQHSGLNEPIPYKAWLPEPIADLDLPFLASQISAAERCAEAMEDFRLLSRTTSCDWFFRVAEGSASTTIEGIYPSPRRLVRAQFSGKGRDAEVSTLANVEAIKEALRIGSSTEALTVGDVQKIHSCLARRLPHYQKELRHASGEFRRQQNWVGGSKLPLGGEQAVGPAHPAMKFVPPTPDRVQELLEDLIAFCKRTDMPMIPQTAVAHARFEEIHPFPDGNGRTGRALVHAMWSKQGLVDPTATIPFSSVLATHREAYIDALSAFHVKESLRTSVDAISPITGIFLTATIGAITTAQKMQKNLDAQLGRWREDLKRHRKTLLDQVLANMPTHPALDEHTIIERYNTTPRHARRIIALLCREGVLVRRNAGPGIWCYEAPVLVDEFKAAFPPALPDDTPDEYTPPPRTGRLRDEWTGAETIEPAWISPQSKRECGVMMPKARKRCVLAAGHAGQHRSVKPWSKKP